MTRDDLHKQARRFAKETSDLLNGTVTHGVRISTLTTSGGRAIMGSGIRKTNPEPTPIPIAPEGGKPVVFLFLIHAYGFDPEGRYLTMEASTMSLYTSPEMDRDQLVVGIDYVREPSNQFPGAHLHVSGHRDDLDDIYLGDKRKTRQLRDLHLPVGGKRFRPTLEDLIEFMVTEEMVVPRPQWRAVVDAHRATWASKQLRAAVRRSPDETTSEYTVRRSSRGDLGWPPDRYLGAGGARGDDALRCRRRMSLSVWLCAVRKLNRSVVDLDFDAECPAECFDELAQC